MRRQIYVAVYVLLVVVIVGLGDVVCVVVLAGSCVCVWYTCWGAMGVFVALLCFSVVTVRVYVRWVRRCVMLLSSIFLSWCYCGCRYRSVHLMLMVTIEDCGDCSHCIMNARGTPHHILS